MKVISMLILMVMLTGCISGNVTNEPIKVGVVATQTGFWSKTWRTRN